MTDIILYLIFIVCLIVVPIVLILAFIAFISEKVKKHKGNLKIVDTIKRFY